MRRLMVGLTLTIAGCSDNGPGGSADPFLGRWLLETVNGFSLPASGEVIVADRVVAGRLVLSENAPDDAWDYCSEDGLGNREARGRSDIVYFAPEDLSDPAEVFFAGNQRDTLRLNSDLLTWEYNLSSNPGRATDLLRFRRLADGEGEGPVCAL